MKCLHIPRQLHAYSNSGRGGRATTRLVAEAPLTPCSQLYPIAPAKSHSSLFMIALTIITYWITAGAIYWNTTPWTKFDTVWVFRFAGAECSVCTAKNFVVWCLHMLWCELLIAAWDCPMLMLVVTYARPTSLTIMMRYTGIQQDWELHSWHVALPHLANNILSWLDLARHG